MQERVPEYEERPHGLHKLGDLEEWEILEGTDIRGWSVVDRDDQQVGKVDDLLVDTDTGDVTHAIVSYGGVLGIGGDRTVVPADEMTLDHDNKCVILEGRTADDLKNAPKYTDDVHDYDQYDRYWHGVSRMPAEERHREETMTEGRRAVIPEVEERLETGKRTEQVGEVEVRKVVETHPRTVRETLRKTRVRVSRRPVEAGRQPREGEPVLREGETVVIPVVEEKMVVEKRPVVTGEVVVEPETVEREAKATRQVRKEHVEVERRGDVEVEEEEEEAERARHR